MTGILSILRSGARPKANKTTMIADAVVFLAADEAGFVTDEECNDVIGSIG